MTTLQGDVRIVKELPRQLESVPRARKHFTSWSSMGYYQEMTHLWEEYQVFFLLLFFSLFIDEVKNSL